MDLVKYVNQDILDIAQLEQKALESYSSVTGKNYTTNARIYKALKDDVIPHYRHFVDLLRDINPKTQEVRELHGIYIRGHRIPLQRIQGKNVWTRDKRRVPGSGGQQAN